MSDIVAKYLAGTDVERLSRFKYFISIYKDMIDSLCVNVRTFKISFFANNLGVEYKNISLETFRDQTTLIKSKSLCGMST